VRGGSIYLSKNGKRLGPGGVVAGYTSPKGPHVKATIDGVTIADAPESDLISIEGNHYFPPASLSAEAFSDSPTPYTCPWKGEAQYHDVSAGGSTYHDAAWSYPHPYPASFDRVEKDYSGYVAFDKRQVTIS
jgi:uncharacterized protein (DUF427 family)